jgi:arginyl-tRNA synthetase
LLAEAREMLRRWEAGDEEVITLWKKMNGWVYEGFDVTYKRLGIGFDKIYYESDTWMEGKKIVEKGLQDSILSRKEDGSVWIDLTDEKLDEKILLRSDGTTVYMTQDLGTAVLRHDEFHPSEMIYVVGNEQNYHFDVLKKTLKKLGYDWADHIHHFSYGMVELPEGKMKSREGTVVDADDLMDEMYEQAERIAAEAGKAQECSVVRT